MSESLYCPLRRMWVKELPEEKIRQTVIQKMIHQLGFPIESLAVEKGLRQLPHLQHSPFRSSLPLRRADLLVFAQNIHPLHAFYPLLLIEFKANSLTKKDLRQLVGYNQFIKAHSIATINPFQEIIGFYDTAQQDFRFQEGLPTYAFLLKTFKNSKIY